MNASPPFILEVLNGDWGVEALCLGIVCWMYLIHEIRARPKRRWPMRWTDGMRVAFAISAVSAGVWITRSVIYIWRHIYGGNEYFSLLELNTLIVGGAIGTLGFLLAIREISKPLFGSWPWLASIVALVAMTAYTVFSRF